MRFAWKRLGNVAGRVQVVLFAISTASPSVVAFATPGFGPAVSLVTSSVHAEFHRKPLVVSSGPGGWVVAWETNSVEHGAPAGGTTVLFSRSSDDGATWTPASILRLELGEPATLNSAIALSSDGSGRLVLVRTARVRVGTGEELHIKVSTSGDHGSSWGPPVSLVDSPPISAGVYYYSPSPAVEMDENGTCVVVWNTIDSAYATPFRLEMSRSTDWGITWSQPAPLNNTTGGAVSSVGGPLIDLDASGNWLVTWKSRDYPWSVFLVRSTDSGASWTAPEVIQPGWQGSGGPSTPPDFATDGQGTWMVAWASVHGSYSGPDKKYSFFVSTSTDLGMTWGTTNVLPFWVGDRNFLFPDVESKGNGEWQIVWESENSLGATIGSDPDILTMRSRDDGVSWTSPTPLLREAQSDSDRHDHVPSIDSTADATAVVTWSSATPEDYGIRVAVARQSCPAAPRTGCRQTTGPGGSILKVWDGTRDRVAWKWKNGEATTDADLGSPDVSGDYVLCLYEHDGIGGDLIGEWRANAASICGVAPCWTRREDRLTFRDRELLHGAVQGIRVKGGGYGRASIRVSVAGLTVAPPALPLDLNAPVRIQLLNLGTGSCWEGVHAQASRNDTTRFDSQSQ